MGPYNEAVAYHRIAGDDQPSRDYARVARAIAFLRTRAAEQPDLAAAARHVHLSEHHFQRVFTRWAGVSPKRFLQFLTVEQAKARLARDANVLDTADAVGLSGAGRLHDLFVTLEAVSPGEFKSGGAGLAIRYGLHASPFGPCLIGATDRGICAVQFVESANRNEAKDRLQQRWPGAALHFDSVLARAIGARIFEPLAARQDRPLALVVRGTNFQIQVWRALLAVPFGRVTTYRELAHRIGHAGAARAVGNAVAANPVAYLIPCHRVIRESAEFGNYRWGEARKAAMLGWEAARQMTALG